MESPRSSRRQLTRSSAGDPLSPRAIFYNINERPVDDISIELFYKPHTLTLLFISIIVVFYIAFTRDESRGPEEVSVSNRIHGCEWCVYVFEHFRTFGRDSVASSSSFSSFRRLPFQMVSLYIVLRCPWLKGLWRVTGLMMQSRNCIYSSLFFRTIHSPSSNCLASRIRIKRPLFDGIALSTLSSKLVHRLWSRTRFANCDFARQTLKDVKTIVYWFYPDLKSFHIDSEKVSCWLYFVGTGFNNCHSCNQGIWNQLLRHLLRARQVASRRLRVGTFPGLGHEGHSCSVTAN